VPLHAQEWLKLGPTHLAPSYTHNPRNGDVYSAYNKPLAVIDFVERFQPAEEWLLFVDADMLLRLPYICKARGGGGASGRRYCSEGRA